MLSSVFRKLVTGAETTDLPGCFCVDCGRTFETDYEDCPECGGHTVDRVQR